MNGLDEMVRPAAPVPDGAHADLARVLAGRHGWALRYQGAVYVASGLAVQVCGEDGPPGRPFVVRPAGDEPYWFSDADTAVRLVERMGRPLYTLDEARARVAAEECTAEGHRWRVEVDERDEPVSVACRRCPAEVPLRTPAARDVDEVAAALAAAWSQAGTRLLPPQPGRPWFDVLRRFDPATARRFELEYGLLNSPDRVFDPATAPVPVSPAAGAVGDAATIVMDKKGTGGLGGQ